MFNVEANDAYVRVSYEGSPAVTLVSAPARLRPSKEGVDPAGAIRLAFSPMAKGRVNGTIVVRAAWQNGIRPPVDLRIPIEAAAHEVGGMSNDEQEAEDRARKEEARQRQLEQDETARADERKRERIENDEPLHGTGAAREALRTAQKHVEDALLDVFDSRKEGVNTAEKEAAKFNRRKPEHEDDLLLRLAFAALDVASVGIAGMLGKTVELALSKPMKTAAHGLPQVGKRFPVGRQPEREHTPSRAIVSFFTDSVKDVAKRGGKAVTGALKGKEAAKEDPRHGASGHPEPGTSSDPLIAFFQTERISLIPQGRPKASAVAERTFDELEPLLASPEHRVKAVEAMEGIARNIRAKLVNNQQPANEQAHASAMHWVQYVAQTSLGSVTAEESRAAGKRTQRHGESTTNVAAANTAPTSRGAPSAHDGLLDIEFEADRFHPEVPATIVHARIHGVSNAIAKRIADASLLTAGIPVRAYSRPGAATLEVVRDEAGNVDYVDNTGAPGMPGNWFARKAGEPLGGRDAALRGARKLIEQELMATELGKITLNDRPFKIETDSDDK